MERLVAEGAPLEQAGVLLGAAYEAGDGYLLEILDVLPFPVTVPEESRVRVSRRAWPEVLKMRSARGPNLRIVGWVPQPHGQRGDLHRPGSLHPALLLPRRLAGGVCPGHGEAGDAVLPDAGPGGGARGRFLPGFGQAVASVPRRGSVLVVGGSLVAPGFQGRRGGWQRSLLHLAGSRRTASRGSQEPGGELIGSLGWRAAAGGHAAPHLLRSPPMGGSRSQSGSGSFAGGLGSSSSSRGAESLRGRSEGLRPPERGSAGEQRGESPLRAPLRGEGRTSRSQGGEEAMPSGPFDTGSESRSSARESG